MDKKPEIVVDKNAFKSFLEETTFKGKITQVMLELDLSIKNKYVVRNRIVNPACTLMVSSATFVNYIDYVKKKDEEKNPMFCYDYEDLRDACNDMDGSTMTILPGGGEAGSTLIKGETSEREIHEVEKFDYEQPKNELIKRIFPPDFKSPLVKCDGDEIKKLVKVFESLEKRKILKEGSNFTLNFMKEGKVKIYLGDITTDSIADRRIIKTQETNIPEDFEASYPYSDIKDVFSVSNSDTIIDINPDVEGKDDVSKWEKPLIVVCRTKGVRKTYFMIAPRVIDDKPEVKKIPKPEADAPIPKKKKKKIPPKQENPIPEKEEKATDSLEGDIDDL